MPDTLYWGASRIFRVTRQTANAYEVNVMDTLFRGVFLTSEKPEATARFYEQVALLTLETVGRSARCISWRVDRGGMQLAIHDAKAFADYAYPPLAVSNVTHRYFKIEYQKAFLTHLERLQIQPLAVDDVTVTVSDPDGRKVIFGTA